MQPAAAPLDWQRDGGDWPHREHSRFFEAAGLRWHVQDWPAPRPGAGMIVLLHGTGASTHSWRGLAPLLARDHAVLAMDLPGHAFTSAPVSTDLSLVGMASALAMLLEAMAVQPACIVGHSAGAAIAVQMALSNSVEGLARIVAINGAFLPFGGVASPLLSPLARLLHAAPWVPRLFARRAADPAVVRRLIEGTGSRLDARGLALYGALIRNPDHARAALGMMAHWDLQPLYQALPTLPQPLVLLAGERDSAVPPRQAAKVAARCASALVVPLPRLGHLAHEEDPAAVADALRGLAGRSVAS